MALFGRARLDVRAVDRRAVGAHDVLVLQDRRGARSDVASTASTASLRLRVPHGPSPACDLVCNGPRPRRWICSTCLGRRGTDAARRAGRAHRRLRPRHLPCAGELRVRARRRHAQLEFPADRGRARARAGEPECACDEAAPRAPAGSLRRAEPCRPHRRDDARRPVLRPALGHAQHGSDGRHARRGHRRARGVGPLDRKLGRRRRRDRHGRRLLASRSRPAAVGQPGRELRLVRSGRPSARPARTASTTTATPTSTTGAAGTG